MNLSHIRIIILESMAVRLGQKGSIYINLKTIHFPGLTAKHGQELSAGHTRTKQKNAAHTPEVHPHDQGVAHVLCCYLTLFITPKNIVRNG